VVTGGAGFLGSHLCERLIAEGWQVIAVDDFTSGDLANLHALHGLPRFEFIRHDVTLPLPQALAASQRLFNLACPASPQRYQRTPVKTTLTSVIGTWQLLALAEETGARLLQASSSEVCGDPQKHPQPESYRGHVNPLGPRACYDEGKRCAETLCFAYHLERDVAIRIARIFNTYGPRRLAGDGRVVSNFIMQALRNEPLTVYGDGRQTRSFCYVDDTIEALCRLLNAEVEGARRLTASRVHGRIEKGRVTWPFVLASCDCDRSAWWIVSGTRRQPALCLQPCSRLPVIRKGDSSP